jgi:hypothetical protein
MKNYQEPLVLTLIPEINLDKKQKENLNGLCGCFFDKINTEKPDCKLLINK